MTSQKICLQLMASRWMLNGMRRHLGEASGISVSALGAGCWAIGGPWQFDGRPAGWGTVDDDESVRAIHTALDLGITRIAATRP